MSRVPSAVLAGGGATIGGISVALAFEPVRFSLGVVVGLVFWLLAASRRGAVSAAVLGMCFGLGFTGVLTVWLADSVSVMAWAGLAAAQSLWFAVLGGLLGAVRSLPFRPVIFAVGWTVIESLRSSWPLGGFPWGRLGVTLVDTPFSGILSWAGFAGTSLLVALMGATVAQVLCAVVSCLKSPRRHRAHRVRIVRRCGFALAGTLVLLAAAAQAASVPPWRDEPNDANDTLTVAVIQSGVPGDGRKLVRHHRRVTANLLRATEDLARSVDTQDRPRPDLVVWPENSTAVDPFSDVTARATIERAVRLMGRPILVGAMVDGPTDQQVLNQSVVWDPAGPALRRYTKRHPVPFGEYIPGRSFLAGVSSRFDQIPRDMVAGSVTRPLNIDSVPVGIAICFDVAFDDVLPVQVRNGARLGIVQTSNASFYGTGQLEQQFEITRARATETGRAIAVASTNGVTALIGPDGAVLERAPIGGTEVLTGEVPLNSHLTPAVRWGHQVPWAMSVALLLIPGIAVARTAKGAAAPLGRSTGARPAGHTPA